MQFSLFVPFAAFIFCHSIHRPSLRHLSPITSWPSNTIHRPRHINNRQRRRLTTQWTAQVYMYLPSSGKQELANGDAEEEEKLQETEKEKMVQRWLFVLAADVTK